MRIVLLINFFSSWTRTHDTMSNFKQNEEGVVVERARLSGSNLILFNLQDIMWQKVCLRQICHFLVCFFWQPCWFHFSEHSPVVFWQEFIWFWQKIPVTDLYNFCLLYRVTFCNLRLQTPNHLINFICFYNLMLIFYKVPEHDWKYRYTKETS